MNPYDWQSHHPKIEIARATLDRVAATLREGGSAVLLGGRGMGKSVSLRQLRATLEAGADTRAVLISAPPAALTVEAFLGHLARRLDVAVSDPLSSSEILEAYFARPAVPERLVLLFDALDRYAGKDPRVSNPGRGFFNDLEAARRDMARLGVLAAGGLGVFLVRDALGSSFLARALHVHLEPFERVVVNALARPFVERGTPLAEPVLDALFLATGGIPALVTFGLQQLWLAEHPPVERDVAAIFTAFRRDHGEYLRDLLASIADPSLSAAPQRVLERIRKTDVPLSRAELTAVLDETEQPIKLDLDDVLRLLAAAGLARIRGSLQTDDPLDVRPIASILDLELPAPAPVAPGLVARLHQDLETLLEKLHRSSADFFRPDRGGTGKILVPESVFAAHLALGFELLGWRVEREAMSAAGRTDLKLRRNGSPDVVVIEVKIWGRNGYRQAQRQVESYWTADVALGVVVQVSDVELPDWAQRYRRECLEPLGLEASLDPLPSSPIVARLTAVSRLTSGVAAEVDHYLVGVARR